MICTTSSSISAGRAVTRLTDERLAEIRSRSFAATPKTHDARAALLDLLAEVDRLRFVEQEKYALWSDISRLQHEINRLRVIEVDADVRRMP